ncbi:amino acid adenylation domain-containing protein [Catenulispora sp. GAS73]|uniref:non-ribosomal peptide synthetase n=1 Tax=Catenulispora sp. GAS73 TaxID=3156269 RepID=UPI0035185008
MTRRIDGTQGRGLVPQGSNYQLTCAQQATWLGEASTEGGSRRTILWAYRLRGDIDPNAVEWALAQVVSRHESLRSRALVASDGLVQIDDIQTGHPLSRLEFPDSGLDELLTTLATEPLDIRKGPIAPTLVHLAHDDWVMAVVLHRTVVDEHSLNVLGREFSHFYRQFGGERNEAAGVAGEPLDTPMQLGAYAEAQRSRPLDEDAFAYWHERLRDLPEPTTIPGDHLRPAEPGDAGDRIRFVVEPELSTAVRRFARASQTGPVTVMAAAVAVLLQQHSRSTDVVLGAAVSRRQGAGAELDTMVGCLADLMPLRLSVSLDGSFGELVRQAASEMLDMAEHREVSLPELARSTGAIHDSGRFPLFQTVVTMGQGDDRGLNLPGATAERLYVHAGTSTFDLCFDFVAGHDAFLGCLDYATDLYETDTARRIAQRYCFLLQAVMADCDRPLNEITLLSPDEFALVTRTWACAEDAECTPALVHHAFEAQRGRTPTAVAAIHGDQQLTYAELGEASDRLARLLAGPGAARQAVGIMMERSLDMAVAVLAVLKSGAPYVPLDPAYPVDRLVYMIQDSGLRTLITQPSLRAGFTVPDDVRIWEPADWAQTLATAAQPPAQAPAVRPDDLAYIMYTSGSTGQPKGIAMPHGPVAGLVDWQCRDSAAGPGDRTLQFSALSFDASFLEFFSTWSTGGTLVIIDAEVRTDYDALLDIIAEQRVMRIFLPFVALQSIAFYATAMDLPTPTLKEFVTAGEQLHVTEAIREFFGRLDGATLFNQYGPTETHSVSSLRLAGDPNGWPLKPSIGYPINGAHVLILDADFRPQPIGIAGELCVAATPVSRGYWQRPGLTAEKFIPHPQAGSGKRLYRTGDLARFLPDGQIEFLGREDGMVKIRGYRVELGEVEARFRSLPGIMDAVVVADASRTGDTRLIAYYRSSEQAALAAARLRSALAEHLPDYMLPARYVAVEGAFPRTPSGKVDRAALSRLLVDSR